MKIFFITIQDQFRVHKAQLISPVCKSVRSFAVNNAIFFLSLAEVKEFFEYLKCERAKDVANMVQKYTAIPQLLIKVEGRVANTNSGKSPKLASYYAYWENRIYQVLTQLIVK